MKPKRTEQEVAFARAQGRMIHDLRTDKDLTRRQIETIAGVNAWTLYRIEMGDSTASAFQIDALSTALAAPRGSLFPTGRGRLVRFDAERRIYA